MSDNMFDGLFDNEGGESEPAVPAIDWIDQPVASIYDNPQVKEWLQQINQLLGLIEGFESVVKDLNAQYNEAHNAKEEYLQTVRQHIVQWDSAMRSADHQRKDINDKLSQARQLKLKLQDQITDVSSQLAAEEAQRAIEERWAKLEAEWDFVWAKLIRNYQIPAVRFTVDAFTDGLGGVLIADQMGLGKTLEACASIDVIQTMPEYKAMINQRCPSIDLDKPEHRTVLWLCPTSIKESTVRELQKWGRVQATKLQGNPDMRHRIVKIANEFGMILVVGYEQLRDRKGQPITPELFEHEWPIVVTDEAHRYKAEGKSTFNNVKKICQKAGFVIPMTGTPIMNRPDEFWSILHMLTLKGKYMGKFDQSWRFRAEYCTAYGYQGKSEFQYGGYERLIKNVEDMVIRRRKDEVLTELPDKIREVHVIDMVDHKEQRDVYDMMRDSLMMWVGEQNEEYIPANNFLAQLTRLRQILLFPAGVKMINPATGVEMTSTVTESTKLDTAFELIEDMLEQDEKVLVFSNYNEPLFELRRRIDAAGFKFCDGDAKTGMIIGGQKDDTRANTVDKFNMPGEGLAVVLGNVKAMGIGLNLQGACSNAIFLDLDWTPAGNEQAEDRLHRIGQKNSVTIHIIHCENSVDEFIAAILEDKANMIEGIMEAKSFRKADIMKYLKDGLI